ncbi:Bug family tripartite tricarboxylate transporter substrate binding protein [Verminephrobacter eiseniae]|uniref:Uncharacterized protein UPF0065 n=1 Tax=Verminephrobacter eiseniae (strain EF01-2) TaxID=391735 RepID=A1WJB2_VEREI|nr:tripartite tricarboxylate transporter substrate-binding protein [Verminephrobacter eiseniae]ABM57719.1 Uncharacterized protein UPF0065 [Verminephrobacter eiseniae EF01-2]MCW5283337.1 tripartite tricarboxylate transporter substrate binding protein [Verminephrobacter eiseniae]MCW5303654.1 tripartite tricarboxylate transporter substrate binding protein [Verminephrobacter eiseniae]MCW8182453.1 tripartite tricarboxylate transporter substrate binding protein [Verminephrobacter eiseniae]MCW8192712
MYQRPRRRAIAMLAASLTGWSTLFGITGVAAQTPSWPTKPVRLVVAFPSGGLADVMARLLQQPLGQALGQPVVIDNRGGAGGNVAGAEVVHNGGDGHTFLVTVSTTESVNPVLFARMPFDPHKDLQPVALLANSQLFLITRPSLAPNSLKEFVAYARAHPGTLSYGSAGNGTTPHLGVELFKQSAGISATHVPYRGAAPAIQDVMAGQIDFSLAPGTVFAAVKAAKLKILAVASRNRSASAPDIPTFSELGLQDVYADTLFGVYAPSHVAPEVIARMNREINHLLALPAIAARFLELGAEAVPLQASEYKAMVRAETRLFTDILKSRAITAD